MPAPTYRPSTATHTQLSSPAVSGQSQTATQSSTPVLRLRAPASDQTTRRRIQWADGVIDNEGLGRKRSKGTNTLLPTPGLRLFLYSSPSKINHSLGCLHQSAAYITPHILSASLPPNPPPIVIPLRTRAVMAPAIPMIQTMMGGLG